MLREKFLSWKDSISSSINQWRRVRDYKRVETVRHELHDRNCKPFIAYEIVEWERRNDPKNKIREIKWRRISTDSKPTSLNTGRERFQRAHYYLR